MPTIDAILVASEARHPDSKSTIFAATWVIRSPGFNRSDPGRPAACDALRLASERAYPVVAGRSARRGRSWTTLNALGALVVAGTAYLALPSHRSQPSRAQVASAVDDFSEVVPLPTRIAPPMPGEIATAPLDPPLFASSPDTLAPPPDTPSSITGDIDPASTDRSMSAEPVASQQPGRAPVLIFDAGPGPANKADRPSAGLTISASADIGDRAVATRLSDPGDTIAQGTLIPAVLETAIDSDLPGYARAIVSRDVASFDRSRILIPRSSKLIGEYASDPAPGQRCVRVTWTRLLRPDGVSIAIGSPGVSPSGAAGLAGKIDDHQARRIGSMALLSIIEAAGVGGGGVVVAGASAAPSLAAEIRPTLRIHSGQPLDVFTARDLKFFVPAVT